jgi:hypothetical protein
LISTSNPPFRPFNVQVYNESIGEIKSSFGKKGLLSQEERLKRRLQREESYLDYVKTIPSRKLTKGEIWKQTCTLLNNNNIHY